MMGNAQDTLSYGRIAGVNGPVVDVLFPEGQLPKLR